MSFMLKVAEIAEKLNIPMKGELDEGCFIDGNYNQIFCEDDCDLRCITIELSAEKTALFKEEIKPLLIEFNGFENTLSGGTLFEFQEMAA